MNAIVDKALILWDLTGAQYRLVAERENRVFHLKSGEMTAALRLHRQGYRSDAELDSELAWMGAMAAAGISVPKPLPNKSGDYLSHIDGVQVDLLSWLVGRELTDILAEPGDAAMRSAHFADLGREMARLHLACDDWTPPGEFTRVHWNREGLVGASPLWDRFWENPALSASQRAKFLAFRKGADARLRALEDSLDYGLIHADLVPANVLVDGRVIRMIDFDDGGFGYRLFELATALLKHRDAPDFEALKAQLIEGYCALRPIDPEPLDFFLALRAATYVGWNITRMTEPGGRARNSRFIETLSDLIDLSLDE